jgi:putative endonuclease
VSPVALAKGDKNCVIPSRKTLQNKSSNPSNKKNKLIKQCNPSSFSEGEFMYVYILKSLSVANQEYIGSTKDLKQRLTQHNRGEQYHTGKYKPWKFNVAVWFEDNEKAIQFEKYLKSGSGFSFRKRHF